jgi:ketosteroid isomerase-like protein
MSQENVEVVRRAIDLCEEGELSSIFAQGLATPDAELRLAFELRGAGTYVGLDGLTEFMRIWTADFVGWELRTERVVGAPGDEVVVLAWQRGRRKASGARVKNLFGMVFMLEDSKIKWVQIHVDPEDALMAAGLRE